jgi:hypothetical protein
MRPSDPPLTVKSWLNAATVRPSTSPVPVTTPSHGRGLFLHAEVVAVVLGVHTGFEKRAFDKERVEPVARSHDALGAAGFELVFSATGFRDGAPFLEFIKELFGNGHKGIGVVS